MGEDSTKVESFSKVVKSLPLLDCMDKSKKGREHLLRGLLREYIEEKGGIESLVLEGQGGVPKDLLQMYYRTVLDGEMSHHLGYEKYEGKGRGSGNSRNGTTKKRVRSEVGELEVETPRDRNGTFEPRILGKREKTLGSFSSRIMSLYAGGMSTRDIEAHLREEYGVDVSEAFISRVTNGLAEEVKAWRSRPLDSLYSVVYFDGIRFPVRDAGRVQKKVVYVALGLTIDGQQEVLGLWIAETESAAFWMNVCQEIAARGTRDILIACVDGLNGLPDAINAVFPRCDIQGCIVHHIRNCTALVAWKDRKEFCADMRLIYTAATLDEAELALLHLEERWGKKYQASIRKWRIHWEKLTTFFKYPVELRKAIYTTNAIESLNSILRKSSSNKKVFPNDDSVFKMMYLCITRKVKLRAKRDWPIVKNQLTVLFEDRIAAAGL